MTINELMAMPPEFKQKMKEQDIEQIEIPADGVVMEKMDRLFAYLSEVERLSMANFRLQGAITMKDMFMNCRRLRHLDLSGIDTSKTMYMSGMFFGCSALKEVDFSGFDTSRVKNMSSMFGDCASLEVLDLSGFDFSRVTNMSFMFSGCSSLREVIFSDSVEEACKGVIRRDTGRTRAADAWNSQDAFTYQQAHSQGILYKTTAPVYEYHSLFGVTEEERRKYLGIRADVKITIVPKKDAGKTGRA